MTHTTADQHEPLHDDVLEVLTEELPDTEDEPDTATEPDYLWGVVERACTAWGWDPSNLDDEQVCQLLAERIDAGELSWGTVKHYLAAISHHYPAGADPTRTLWFDTIGRPVLRRAAGGGGRRTYAEALELTDYRQLVDAPPGAAAHIARTQTAVAHLDAAPLGQLVRSESETRPDGSATLHLPTHAGRRATELSLPAELGSRFAPATLVAGLTRRFPDQPRPLGLIANAAEHRVAYDPNVSMGRLHSRLDLRAARYERLSRRGSPLTAGWSEPQLHAMLLVLDQFWRVDLRDRALFAWMYAFAARGASARRAITDSWKTRTAGDGRVAVALPWTKGIMHDTPAVSDALLGDGELSLTTLVDTLIWGCGLAGDDHLFPAFARAGHRLQRDGDGRTSPIDRKIVNRQIQVRSERAGIARHPTGHTPRRSRATSVYDTTGTLAAATQLLGQTDPHNTLAYIDRGPGDQAAQAVTDTIAAAWTGIADGRHDTSNSHGPRA